MRRRHKFVNNLAKSLEEGMRCDTQKRLWTGMGLALVVLKDPDELTKLEVIKHMEHVKEKNGSFVVCQDNTI